MSCKVFDGLMTKLHLLWSQGGSKIPHSVGVCERERPCMTDSSRSALEYPPPPTSVDFHVSAPPPFFLAFSLSFFSTSFRSFPFFGSVLWLESIFLFKMRLPTTSDLLIFLPHNLKNKKFMDWPIFCSPKRKASPRLKSFFYIWVLKLTFLCIRKQRELSLTGKSHVTSFCWVS